MLPPEVQPDEVLPPEVQPDEAFVVQEEAAFGWLLSGPGQESLGEPESAGSPSSEAFAVQVQAELSAQLSEPWFCGALDRCPSLVAFLSMVARAGPELLARQVAQLRSSAPAPELRHLPPDSWHSGMHATHEVEVPSISFPAPFPTPDDPELPDVFPAMFPAVFPAVFPGAPLRTAAAMHPPVERPEPPAPTHLGPGPYFHPHHDLDPHLQFRSDYVPDPYAPHRSTLEFGTPHHARANTSPKGAPGRRKGGPASLSAAAPIAGAPAPDLPRAEDFDDLLPS